MADFRTRLQLDGSDFNSTLDSAGKSVNDFSKQTQDASKQVDDLGKTTKKTASELLQEMKTMEGLGRSTSNYRSQLVQMTKQIQDLSINYSKMSSDMKNSDFGREVAAQIQELTSKAAEYRDALGDASQATKLLASDTVNLDAAKSAIEGLSAGMQLFASVGILGEENTEKVVKALAKLKAIESATNAVIKISNILNKDSILMLKIKSIQTSLATKATIAQTTATKGATVAQRAFNTVAKANPYVLLATAILTVVGALVAFTRGTEEDTEAQERHQKELEEQERKYREYADSLGTVMTKYKQLQIAWKELSDVASKQNFIKEHKKDFDDLGIAINSVDDAEKLLVQNTEAVMKVFALRAKAAAAASLATQAYTAALMKEQQVTNNPKKTFKAMDRIPENMYGDLKTEHAQRQGLSQNIRGEWYFTEEGARQVSELNKQIDGVNQKYKEGDEWLEKQNDFLKEAQDILKSLNLSTPTTNNTNGNGGSGSQGDPFEVGSAAYYSKLITEINNKLQNQANTKEQILEYEQQIQRLEALRDRALGKEPANMIPQLKMRTGLENSMEPIKIPATLHIEEMPEVSFNDLNNGISDAIGGFQSMNSAVANVGKSIEDLGSGWDDSKSALENITTKVGDVFSIMQSVCGVIDTMNKLAAVFEGIENISWLLEKKKNQEKAKGVALATAETAVEGTNATLGVVQAITGVIKSASEIPMVGWILGLGAVAAVIAAIASAPKFAKGGIVPGNSFSGDNITAQVNSGEMILNTNQQARLFDLLNGEGSFSSGSNKVEFVIKGQELKGVLNNYDKKMSRV